MRKFHHFVITICDSVVGVPDLEVLDLHLSCSVNIHVEAVGEQSEFVSCDALSPIASSGFTRARIDSFRDLSVLSQRCSL
jgi:hypothetical protein